MAKGNQVREIAKELIWSFETKYSSQQNSERTGCKIAGRLTSIFQQFCQVNPFLKAYTIAKRLLKD